jgi:peroxiredoxin
MALTYTPEATLGSPCPDFDLPTVDGKRFKRSDLIGFNATVIMFICNHCPYVQAVEQRLVTLAAAYSAKGVRFVGICSNDPTDYPEDEPAALLQRWREQNYSFPYLIDKSQTVAKSFGAVCTPDLFVFDDELKLSYRGRLDDSWRDATRVQKEELKAALDALLNGASVNPQQNPAMGCSIKWKGQL